ncbi:hypothetical protein FIBSPDRAFT_888827 [Athelia psychrophila]|uniref:Uncharacterized protein n=1 Tax=Athelia psychrophila TaxID=1759441 RepID=A0A166MVF7_9AGAM|nr:hypothetical protein FIBSPDRAFT_888827 [Fibularhizoctonia sp. CBS 109695]
MYARNSFGTWDSGIERVVEVRPQMVVILTFDLIESSGLHIQYIRARNREFAKLLKHVCTVVHEARDNMEPLNIYTYMLYRTSVSAPVVMNRVLKELRKLEIDLGTVLRCPCTGPNEELECGGDVTFSIALDPLDDLVASHVAFTITLDPLDDLVRVITIRSSHPVLRTG